MFEKIVIVTRKTPLEELIEKLNSKLQARFYLEHSGVSFQEYERAHNAYHLSLHHLKDLLPKQMKVQFIDRSFLPNFLFGVKDLIITLGQDGLVINTAKYLREQPILALNPDPVSIDGILIPFQMEDFTSILSLVLKEDYYTRKVSMAHVKFNDGQELYGVNDIFIGPRSQVSFRYEIEMAGKKESQCSSGIIVSTGAGSTGWFRSIMSGAESITRGFHGFKNPLEYKEIPFSWESDYLCFCVREPFPSKATATGIVFGKISKENPLYVTSQTPQGAVIFSDGIENDFLEFSSGKIARVELAARKANLIVRSAERPRTPLHPVSRRHIRGHVYSSRRVE